jgi:ribonuclease J
MGIPEERVLIAENGDVICFENRTARLDGHIHTGRILVDGKGVGDVGEIILRDRRRLSGDGMVVVLLAVDESTGETIYGPEMISRGFVFEDKGELLLEDAKCIVLEILDELDRPSPIDRTGVESDIKKRLQRFFYKVIERSPLILPVIISI